MLSTNPAGSFLYVFIQSYNISERLSYVAEQCKIYCALPYERINIQIIIGPSVDAAYSIYLREYLKHTLENINPEAHVSLVRSDSSLVGFQATWTYKERLRGFAFTHPPLKGFVSIYQEDDCVITEKNINYWVKWEKVLAGRGFYPGFLRYEEYEGRKIPFDNFSVYSMLKETPNVWSDVGFKCPTIPVQDSEIEFFTQLGNPYYGAWIASFSEVCEHFHTHSSNIDNSYLSVGPKRNWPVADRASMGMCFENVPKGSEHRRCVPVVKHKEWYKPHPDSLILHRGTKYSEQLAAKHPYLVDVDHMLSPC